MLGILARRISVQGVAINSRTWIASVLCRLFAFENRLSKQRKLRRRYRPHLEQMEDRITPAKSLLVFDGDSITYGLGQTGGQTYPRQTVDLLGGDSVYQSYNFGVVGQTVADMESDAVT